MQVARGSSVMEGVLIDWAMVRPEPEPCIPVFALDDEQVAAELERLQANQARNAAREADLILRLGQLRPDTDDPPPGSPGGRRRGWRKTEPEFPGVSEFFPDEVAHAINLGRGTAVFRARRAWTWQDNLPATFSALRRGEIDERRAGVLAKALQHTAPELSRQIEEALLPGATDLSLAELERRALELLAELDAEAIAVRHEEAKKAADVRAYDTGDGMSAVTVDMPAEEAAAVLALVNTLAEMAKADGDERPIGAIRASIASMLLLRPAEHGMAGVHVHLAVTATLDGLEGRSGAGGEVNGSAVTAAQLRELLRRVGALGLTTPDGGSLTFAITDADGRLLATLTANELERLAKKGCPEHPDTEGGRRAPENADDETSTDCQTADDQTADDQTATGDEAPGDSSDEQAAGAASEGGAPAGGCDCPVAGMPPATDAYTPTAAQKRFVNTRDRRCRLPNCGQRAGWADHDHVIPHDDGGETTCTNLCCLCRSHHRLKTFAPGWQFRMDPDGTLHVTSASGITRTTRPPGMRPPKPPPGPPPYDPTADPPPF